MDTVGKQSRKQTQIRRQIKGIKDLRWYTTAGQQPDNCRAFGTLQEILLTDFYPRDVVSGVFATATWLGGWLGVCHRRYCIKTTKPILKLFRPSGSPIIESFGTPFAYT